MRNLFKIRRKAPPAIKATEQYNNNPGFHSTASSYQYPNAMDAGYSYDYLTSGAIASIGGHYISNYIGATGTNYQFERMYDNDFLIAWKCDYCGSANKIDDLSCHGCGSSMAKSVEWR
jgi:hypothetical protein